MTGTSASPVTVREARPEEGPAVAALLRESYVAFAAELPPDLLRGWIDDVLDPRGPRRSWRWRTGRSPGRPGCTPQARTRSRSRPGASGCGPLR